MAPSTVTASAMSAVTAAGSSDALRSWRMRSVDTPIRMEPNFVLMKLPGERTLILVSPGFQPIEEVARAEESRLMDLAAQSNVTISALDTLGVYNTEITASMGRQASSPYQADIRRSSMSLAESALGELADGTGGVFFHGSNDLESGFKALEEGPEVVYVLELPLTGAKSDGSYHRLKVKVSRDGVDVQARRGYFVPKPEKKKK